MKKKPQHLTILSLSGALIMLYKNQDYVHFDQFVSCFVIMFLNNALFNFNNWHLQQWLYYLY